MMFSLKKGNDLCGTKLNAFDRSKAEQLFEEYAKRYDPQGDKGSAWEPQNISRWLSGKGLDNKEIQAVIGIWRGMMSGD